VNLLIDENLSPSIVHHLAAKGVPAAHVAHIGLQGAIDPDVWRCAYEHDQVVVTINAADFLFLAG
jgi:predicted nuclease of predicted toxin-antitoxin system